MPAYFAATVSEFLHRTTEDLELHLIRAYEQDRFKELMVPQISSWREEIEALQRALRSDCLRSFEPASWGIALEFVIPRRMGRMDAVILIGDAIVGIEFKTNVHGSNGADQVEDYCLDLLHFHEPSHERAIYPIVVDVNGNRTLRRKSHLFTQLRPTTLTSPEGLAALVAEIARNHSCLQMAIESWNEGEYHPVPTIVEAAIGMFAEMQVADIAKADCDPINLTATLDVIQAICRKAKNAKRKTICFVTGVPGAGKTLAGLRLVHDPLLQHELNANGVFLTGNLPLVLVLRSALARDTVRRKKQHLRISTRNPKTTIQTVLGYKKSHTSTQKAPDENVVVFDEAQRAWTAKRTEKYLKKDDPLKGLSEPEIMMAILERHDWAVLVALVGGGQEINDGEAGIGEWGRALCQPRFRNWQIAVSPQALRGDYGAGAKLFEGDAPNGAEIDIYPNLHLDNPLRQYRGKTIANWAESLLHGNADACRRIIGENPEYPIFLTRDLQLAKNWLLSVTVGSERFGLIASSQARRLRAEGMELQPARADGVDHWFLAPHGDVRSSFQLEVAANEFQIQGLEIDWACICWGGDFLRDGSEWVLKNFVGTRWQNVKQTRERVYIQNTYRVLLTRARRGLILFVPFGSEEDDTRPLAPFDKTAKFLESCGAKILESLP